MASSEMHPICPAGSLLKKCRRSRKGHVTGLSGFLGHTPGCRILAMSRIGTHSDNPSITVPGNLLLLGEYAVLEEGGLGVALAVERRVRLRARPSARLLIEGIWPGGGIRWTGPRDGNPVLTETVAGVTQWMEHRGLALPLPAVSIRIDSSALFGADGRKAGFGSSASVAVGLTRLLMVVAGSGSGDGPEESDDTVRLALESHRRAQGGVGSGYDILSSFHGGAGAFRGGTLPSWRPWYFGKLLDLALFRGKAPVSTADSVQRYQDWKRRDPSAARELLEQSNAAVSGFVAAATTAAALQRFAAAREIGLLLGERIGVSARIEAPPGVDPPRSKAVGAGNELGVCALEPSSSVSLGADLERLIIADQGLIRER